ncbi:MAG: hypothetical protein HC849_24525 [Oscillatoriales cyanobacterium RU_3_3]|nr:hypothetical protein [Oscillatoriales cyanobacterium RU_3_3]
MLLSLKSRSPLSYFRPIALQPARNCLRSVKVLKIIPITVTSEGKWHPLPL